MVPKKKDHVVPRTVPPTPNLYMIADSAHAGHDDLTDARETRDASANLQHLPWQSHCVPSEGRKLTAGKCSLSTEFPAEYPQKKVRSVTSTDHNSALTRLESCADVWQSRQPQPE